MFSWLKEKNAANIQSGRPALILYDRGTNALLAAGTHPATFNFLVSAIPESAMTYIEASRYNKAILNWTPQHRYPTWAWNKKTRKLSPLRKDAQHSLLKAKAQLAQEKAVVIRDIIFNINVVRDTLQNGLVFQDRIYLSKKIEAQRFKDQGASEEHALEYPYLLQYADLKNIPLADAANEILFKAKVADEMLAKTETLRIGYFDRVRNAHKIEELAAIYQEFIRDCYRNALV